MGSQAGANRWGWRRAVAITIVAVVAYFLSAGPVLWIELHHFVPKQFQNVPIYAPIQWLIERGPTPVRRILQWYLGLWI